MRALFTGRSGRVAVVCLLLGFVTSVGAWASARAFAESTTASATGADDEALASHVGAPEALDRATRQGSTPPIAAPRYAALSGATELETGVGQTRVVPPRRAAPASVVTFLHGACMDAAETCARMDPLTDDGAWLVCPTGNASCGGGASDWAGDGAEKAAHLDASVDAVLAELELPSAGRGDGDVLMGFSRGAFVARDVVYARPGRYRALVLVGAAIIPDTDLLKKNGIERVVLAAGDYDGSRRTMVQAQTRLCAAGIPTRFVGLGPVWHALPKDSPKRMRDALQWVRESGSAGPASCKAPPAVRVPGA